MFRRLARSLTLIIMLASLPWIVNARAKDPMNIEDGVLDVIHLKVQSISPDSPVLIHPFSIDRVDLGTGAAGGKEARVEAAKAMLVLAPELLSDALRASLLEGGVFKEVLDSNMPSPAEPCLIVEGKFISINPGSRAKRYWGGFGAGKSGVQVAGTVKDCSGAILADFTHMKHSGIGLAGGDYLKFLSDDAKDVGRDIGKFLGRWATGRGLQED